MPPSPTDSRHSMQVKAMVRLDPAVLPLLLDNFQISKPCCPRLILDKGISVFT